jgi:hypothetical protein
MSDTDTLFQLLARSPRRRILIALCDRERIRVPADIRLRSAVASQPAADAPRVAVGEGPAESRLAIQLRHRDLPRMEEEGAIEWDRETDVVSRGPRFDAIEPALQLLATNTESLPGGLC